MLLRYAILSFDASLLFVCGCFDCANFALIFLRKSSKASLNRKSPNTKKKLNCRIIGLNQKSVYVKRRKALIRLVKMRKLLLNLFPSGTTEKYDFSNEKEKPRSAKTFFFFKISLWNLLDVDGKFLHRLNADLQFGAYEL